MRPSIPQGQIRPKLSNRPQQKSEATACLDVYKLVVEKKRLQQELSRLDQRRIQIQKRLIQLDQQIETIEQNIQDLREPTTQTSELSLPAKPVPTMANSSQSPFTTFTLEY